MSHPEIPQVAAEAFSRDELVLFVGSGISLPYENRSGLPGAHELSSILARRLLQREVGAEESLMQIAQEITWQDSASRQRLHALLIEVLANPNVQQLPAHAALAATGVNIITTNYDSLIERAFQAAGQRVSVAWKDEHLLSLPEPYLIKIHGSIEEPSTCVITEDDYYHWLDREPELRDYVRALLLTKTMCFVGYSLADSNFRSILRVLRLKFGQIRRPGLVVLNKPNPASYDYRYIAESLGLRVHQDDATSFLRALARLGKKSPYTDIMKSQDVRERYFGAELTDISYFDFAVSVLIQQIETASGDKYSFDQPMLDRIRTADALKNLPSMHGPYDIEDRLVLVPAGPFIAGGERHGNELIRIETILKPYRIGIHATTNQEYREFVNWCTGTTHDRTFCHPAEPPGKDHRSRDQENPHDIPLDYSANPAYNSHPVVNVDWWDAYAYSRWAGARLPTDLEWERAARGVDGRRYPWGDDFDIAMCNTEEAGLRRTVPVGSMVMGRSPAGLFEMCGNVWEWCEDEYFGPGQPSSVARIVRGGSFSRGEYRGRCAYRNGREPDAYWCSRGFRIARDVK